MSRDRYPFSPDWTLSAVEQMAVKLMMALPKHIPEWPGATDEQIIAVAEEILAIPVIPSVHGMEFLCDIPKELGGVVGFETKNGKLFAVTESGTEFIVPYRRSEAAE